MPLNDYDDLTPMQLDALCEIGNIGSGNAASALSTMLDKPVNISVPTIRILDYSEVVENMGGAEKLMAGLLLSVSGDVTGMLMFLLEKEFANMVLSTLLGEEVEAGSGELDEMGSSAIREIGNIMASSYINAIASMTGMVIDISVPSLCIDMTGALLSVPAIYYANISDKIIFIQNEFDDISSHASSHVLLVPEIDSLKDIMQSLGLEE